MRPIPKATIGLVKRFEERKLTAYKCPANVWTVGYGQTGPDIVEGTQWTIWQCEDRLKATLGKVAEVVDRLVTVDLTDNERGALICFVYNIGEGAFKASTMRSLLNQGLTAKAADEFLKWNKGGGKVLNGLTARRAAEQALFLKKD